VQENVPKSVQDACTPLEIRRKNSRGKFVQKIVQKIRHFSVQEFVQENSREKNRARKFVHKIARENSCKKIAHENSCKKSRMRIRARNFAHETSRTKIRAKKKNEYENT
jgi:hypothetical protein